MHRCDDWKRIIRGGLIYYDESTKTKAEHLEGHLLLTHFPNKLLNRTVVGTAPPQSTWQILLQGTDTILPNPDPQ